MEERSTSRLRGQLSTEEIRELLERVDLLTEIKQLDMGVVEEEIRRHSTPIEEYVRLLKEGKDTQKALRQKTAKPKKRKKQHHSTKRKYQRDYHRMVRKGRRIERKAEAVKKDGWWAVLSHSWRNKGLEVRITKEEWDERITPLVEEMDRERRRKAEELGTPANEVLGVVPSVWRYDTSGPIEWSNVWVRDRMSRETIYDYNEELLKEGGWILS